MIQADDKPETGIRGFDDVLNGGFSRGHVFAMFVFDEEPGLLSDRMLALNIVVFDSLHGFQAADVTYLVGTVVLLRYIEARGTVRRALSIIKKRAGRHESNIREDWISADGLALREPLEEFQGVLRGVPSYFGDRPGLVEGRNP